MSDNRNSDHTYNSLPYGASEQRNAGVSSWDSESAARYKVEKQQYFDAQDEKARKDADEANWRAGAQWQNADSGGSGFSTSSDSIGSGGSSGAGRMLLVLLVLGALFVLWIVFKQKANEYCVFGFSFDNSVCRYKKIIGDRMPAQSEEDLRTLAYRKTDAKDINYIRHFTGKACSTVIGNAPICGIAETLRKEEELIEKFGLRDHTAYRKGVDSSAAILTSLPRLEFVKNSLGYYGYQAATKEDKASKEAYARVDAWGKFVKEKDDKLRQKILGKWVSSKCTNAYGDQSRECNEFAGISYVYTNGTESVALPNGRNQSVEFIPSGLAVAGNTLISPKGNTWEFLSDNRMMFRWKNLAFTLDRIR